MKPAEKDEIMGRFSRGEINILVSTTVIEVGVNVPNATLMVVENAERFGLSQLHQLRGRVGRGSRKSYCILVSDSNSEKSKERLEVMRTTYDGYAIAEQDLMLRGPGDFFSSNSDDNIRQSGGFEFNAVKFLGDTELVDAAFGEAKSIAKADPTLKLAEHAELKKSLQKHLLDSSSLIS
jgi:ATP-dependent DNA helicase RecG